MQAFKRRFSNPPEYEGNQVDNHQAARDRGLIVKIAGPRDVYLDLDSPQDEYVMDSILGLLRERGIELNKVYRTRSEHGNRHVVLRSRHALTDLERIALQAVLGSDRKREALALARWFDGDESAKSVLYELPQELDKVGPFLEDLEPLEETVPF